MLSKHIASFEFSNNILNRYKQITEQKFGLFVKITFICKKRRGHLRFLPRSVVKKTLLSQICCEGGITFPERGVTWHKVNLILLSSFSAFSIKFRSLTLSGTNRVTNVLNHLSTVFYLLTSHLFCTMCGES